MSNKRAPRKGDVQSWSLRVRAQARRHTSPPTVIIIIIHRRQIETWPLDRQPGSVLGSLRTVQLLELQEMYI